MEQERHGRESIAFSKLEGPLREAFQALRTLTELNEGIMELEAPTVHLLLGRPASRHMPFTASLSCSFRMITPDERALHLKLA